MLKKILFKLTSFLQNEGKNPISAKLMLTLYDEFLHFLDKCGIRLGEAGALVSTQRRAGVKEVDSEVSVVPFYRLADVLIKTKKAPMLSNTQIHAHWLR